MAWCWIYKYKQQGRGMAGSAWVGSTYKPHVLLPTLFPPYIHLPCSLYTRKSPCHALNLQCADRGPRLIGLKHVIDCDRHWFIASEVFNTRSWVLHTAGSYLTNSLTLNFWGKTPPKQLTRTFGLVTNVLQLYYPQKLDISGGRTLLAHFTMLVVKSIAWQIGQME